MEELALVLALLLCGALIWAVFFGLVFFLSRLAHASLRKTGLPIARLIPGLVVFLLIGYPAARWLAGGLALESFGWMLSIGSVFACASMIFGIAAILLFPALEETTGVFALSAALLSRSLLLPFEPRLEYASGANAAVLFFAAAFLFGAFYAMFRTRFAHQTSGHLQLLAPRPALLGTAVALTMATWAGCVWLGQNLPERMTQKEGALFSLAGLLLVMGAVLSMAVALHLQGLSRRAAAGSAQAGRSAYWFVPACLLFAISAGVHIGAGPPRADLAARLRIHGLLSYDLWATARPWVTRENNSVRMLPTGSMKPMTEPLPAPGGQPDTLFLLTVLGSRRLPVDLRLRPVFVGTDRSAAVLARITTRVLGTRKEVSGVFVDAEYRTICGGWDGGLQYLKPGSKTRLHVGCQVHLPLNIPRTPSLSETVDTMLEAYDRYREKRTFVWIHYERGKDQDGLELDRNWKRLSARGRAILAVTEVDEPSMAFVSWTPGTFVFRRSGQSTGAEPARPWAVANASQKGWLVREFRPSPFLVYRAAAGHLPAIVARAGNGRMLLWDPAGGARWERPLALPARAAGGVAETANGVVTAQP